MAGLKRGKFAGVVLVLQVIFIVLFALFVEYDKPADAKNPKHSRDVDKGGADPDRNQLASYYPLFQDVHVMIFAGIGFLLTFMKRYGFSGVGFNLLIGGVMTQWSMLMGGFLHLHDGKIHINIVNVTLADIGAATVLISFCSVLGQVSPLQMMVIGLLELVFYHVNEWIGLEFLQVSDVGGSMFVHVFAAYFGLGLAKLVYTEEIEDHGDKEGTTYHSDLFCTLGTMLLWMFWPSFNGVLARGDDRHRAVINTYLSLAACTLVTFAVSSLIDRRGRFNMMHIQNATLAGGVAIGTAANMMISPWGAMLVGAIAGCISTLGFSYLTPFLNRILKLHDACGVHNLHGVPGILAAIVGAILAAIATEDTYGKSLYELFPARAPAANSTEMFELNAALSDVEPGSARTAGEQAAYQMAALALTIAISTVGGLITGVIARIPIWDQPKNNELFDDTKFWELPEEEIACSTNGLYQNGNHKSDDTKI